MIIERNEFRLKFGKAKEAIAIWNEILEVLKDEKNIPPVRFLSDLSGPAYTIIFELRLKDYKDIGPKNYMWLTNERTQQLYQKFIPLCESAERTYFTIQAEYNTEQG